MKPLLPLLVAGVATLGALALPTQNQSAAQEPAKYEDRLTKLSWMAGHWSGRGRQFFQEEVWLESRGNLMLGLHRDYDLDGNSSGFEYLRIELVAGDIVYQASPSGRGATPFKLVSSAAQKAVFENPEHDFPQRITYSRTEDVLTAQIGMLKGEPAATFKWTLVE